MADSLALLNAVNANLTGKYWNCVKRYPIILVTFNRVAKPKQ